MDSKFKFFNKIIFCILVIFAASIGNALANPPTVSYGYTPYDEELAGVRYRSFANTGGEEIYIGVPDLGVAKNREETDIIWVSGDNEITFIYDKDTDKLTTTVVNSAGTFTLEYFDLYDQLDNLGKDPSLLDELDVMQITVANRDDSTAVCFCNVYLTDVDGNSYFLGCFGGTGVLDWMVTDFDFSQGFTITGKIFLDGTFSNSQEKSKVEIKVGVQNTNEPPDCSSAYPSPNSVWPPDHSFSEISVMGVTDPDGDDITITIDQIFQDEPVNSQGDGNFAPDGMGIGEAEALIRNERQGSGNGRVYHIEYTADDGQGGFCSGEVLVGVPKSMGNKWRVPVDDGALFDSTVGSAEAVEDNSENDTDSEARPTKHRGRPWERRFWRR